MESNLLKEIWTPNIYRILLQKDTNKLINHTHSLLIDELRFSEIGFPVWSNEWFEYPINPSKTSVRNHIKRVRFELLTYISCLSSSSSSSPSKYQFLSLYLLIC